MHAGQLYLQKTKTTTLSQLPICKIWNLGNDNSPETKTTNYYLVSRHSYLSIYLTSKTWTMQGNSPENKYLHSIPCMQDKSPEYKHHYLVAAHLSTCKWATHGNNSPYMKPPTPNTTLWQPST